jgi:hypothetical protein
MTPLTALIDRKPPNRGRLLMSDELLSKVAVSFDAESGGAGS